MHKMHRCASADLCNSAAAAGNLYSGIGPMAVYPIASRGWSHDAIAQWARSFVVVASVSQDCGYGSSWWAVLGCHSVCLSGLGLDSRFCRVVQFVIEPPWLQSSQL